MSHIKLGTKSALSAALAGLLLLSGVAWQNALAQGAPRPAGAPAAQPAALATTLSYYFISGDTFIPSAGPVTFQRQVTACVNQMPLDVHMVAPVHLPQASVVVSMTLFAFDTVVTTTFSTAYFESADGKGGGVNLLLVDSDSGITGYQQRVSAPSSVAINNQNNAYEVEWRKVPQEGPADSPFLSLCGVRLAYYAPLSATFLPVTVR